MLFLIICLIVAGTVAGGATMNPIILGIIPGSGLILITYCETKIELCRLVFTTYEKTRWIKVLHEGMSFGKESYLE